MTAAVQLAPGARLVPHCEFRWKSGTFVPPIKRPRGGATKLAATVPLVVIVTVCGALLDPTATLPKLSEGDAQRAWGVLSARLILLST